MDNPFLIACAFNKNIKVIKYIHKLFPSLINSQLNRNQPRIPYSNQNGALLVIFNLSLGKSISDKLNILHYLYLNGIDIHLHLLSKHNQIYKSIFSISNRSVNDYWI